MARSLAERLRAHEQQKARLAEQEAKLKDAGRKARTGGPVATEPKVRFRSLGGPSEWQGLANN